METVILLKISKNALLPGFFAMTVACASLPSSNFTYNEIAIVNQTGLQISEVTISSTESGRMFGCGNIAPRGICSNKFPPQSYTGSPLQITWRVGNGKARSKTIELALPVSFVAELPMRGVLLIDPLGQVLAYLQQEVPGPHL